MEQTETALTPDQETALGRQISSEMRDAGRYAAPRLECDLVMKGGIASGVVYPLTVCRLATTYRLRSIGGTSAGAIAAVVAAAAEYRRQQVLAADTANHSTAGAGFAELASLPDQIATAIPGLFLPSPAARPLFDVLEAGMGRRGPALVGRLAVALVRRRPWWFLAGVLGTLALALVGREWAGLGLALLPMLVPALVVGLLCAGFGLVRLAMRVLPGLDFGLTNGVAGPSKLADWMHTNINAVAAKPSTEPLTLGDLWGSAAVAASASWAATEADDLGDGQDDEGSATTPAGVTRRRRSIDLEMMTTDLSTGRPMRLPFRDQTNLFSRTEFESLFPGDVVDTMCFVRSQHRHPSTDEQLWYFPGPGRAVTTKERQQGVQGERMPGPSQLPVVVMARMSLSFPGLISAVPLYAVDHAGDGTVRRHLFSDGGISSNFPMHFFDSLLPVRPTFGVNLTAPHPQFPDQRVWRPTRLNSGTSARVRDIPSVGAFAGALRDSVQNWSDNLQVTQKGYADRVVEIRLDSSEGGMNLHMDADTIWRMVARGALAGDELLDFDWPRHQKVRYRIAMARLTDALENFHEAFGRARYDELLDGIGDTGEASSFFRGKAWRQADREATDGLLGVIQAWDDAGWPALKKPRPSPAPTIRMAPE